MDNKLETHWKRHFDYRFMGSYSLDEGQEVVRTIEKLGNEEIIDHENGEVIKSFIAHFKGEDGENIKPMFFNKTVCKTLENLYGNDPNNWIGKDVQIFVEKGIKVDGGIVDGLRVRNFIPTEISMYNEETQRLIRYINNCKEVKNLQSIKKHCVIGYTKKLYDNKLKELK